MKSDGANHRERMRQRFAKSGFVGFNDYEVLEFLLFFIFKRVDTKPIAKRLLKRFGTFAKTLDAAPDDLAEIEGMGKASALGLKAMRNALQYYFNDLTKDDNFIVSDAESLKKLIAANIAGKSSETLLAIFLNSKNGVVSTEVLSEGDVNQTAAYPRQIAQQALKSGAAAIILAHNHPDGSAEPSAEDYRRTDEIEKALDSIEVELIDHFVIGGGELYSIKRDYIVR